MFPFYLLLKLKKRKFLKKVNQLYLFFFVYCSNHKRLQTGSQNLKMELALKVFFFTFKLVRQVLKLNKSINHCKLLG